MYDQIPKGDRGSNERFISRVCEVKLNHILSPCHHALDIIPKQFIQIYLKKSNRFGPTRFINGLFSQWEHIQMGIT